MGGIAAALVADVLGGLLLLVGGPAAIWRTLWVFWAESAAGGIVAAVLLRRGMASLSDEAWLSYASQTLDAEARRGPSDDETPYQHALRLQQRRDRLAALAAIDRRTPEGAAAFAHARATEGNAVGGILGCVFVGFSMAHAVFLLMLGLFQAVFQTATSAFVTGTFGDPGSIGLNDPGWGSAAAPQFGIPSLGGLLPLLLVMGVVFAIGLVPLRRPAQMADGEASAKEAMTRTFILQIVLILGSLPAIFLGSVPLAFAFVVVKTAADVYPLWRKRRAVSR